MTSFYGRGGGLAFSDNVCCVPVGGKSRKKISETSFMDDPLFQRQD